MASHSQVRWRFVRGHDKPRLMGVASHRSFPGGICKNHRFVDSRGFTHFGMKKNQPGHAYKFSHTIFQISVHFINFLRIFPMEKTWMKKHHLSRVVESIYFPEGWVAACFYGCELWWLCQGMDWFDGGMRCAETSGNWTNTPKWRHSLEAGDAFSSNPSFLVSIR